MKQCVHGHLQLLKQNPEQATGPANCTAQQAALTAASCGGIPRQNACTQYIAQSGVHISIHTCL